MTKVRVRRTLLAIALLSIGAACTVHQAATPPLAGPSDFALSLTVVATPDSISQDGGSQSSIRVTTRGPEGNHVAGVSLRVDMQVNGVAQDFGVLSARNIVTGSDGTASVVYTAPPGAPGGITGTCKSLPGTCVTIVATPVGTDFSAAVTRSAEIRLVPVGVILPPADTPTAQFTFAPSSPTAHSPVAFDASTSCGGRADTSGCLPSNNTIVSYGWNFGDGASGSGKTTTHAYSSVGTFNATLTATNDRGLSASTTKQIAVGAGTPPTAAFVFSPTAVVVGVDAFFDASASQAAPGHTIAQYQWNWGDGTPISTRTTPREEHDWVTAGTYTIVLTVIDEAGQQGTTSQTITVGSGAPTVAFTTIVTNPAAHAIQADGSASSGAGGSTIVTYTFGWGDGNTTTGGAVQSHSYAAAGTYTVRLTVTDSLGRSGVGSANVVVP